MYANTAVKGEVAADNSLYLGSYSAEKDGAVVFSGVGHEFDDENYLATRVSRGGCFFAGGSVSGRSGGGMDRCHEGGRELRGIYQTKSGVLEANLG